MGMVCAPADQHSKQKIVEFIHLLIWAVHLAVLPDDKTWCELHSLGSHQSFSRPDLYLSNAGVGITGEQSVAVACDVVFVLWPA